MSAAQSRKLAASLPANLPTAKNFASGARKIAYDCLWRVETDAAFAANLLASNLVTSLPLADRALVTELVLGVLRQQTLLDYYLTKLLTLPLAKLDTAVRLILRLGLYQLLFLARVPAHAIVNEAVKLVKQCRKTSAASLVNAVLRRAAQRIAAQEADFLTITAATKSEKWSIQYSHPLWLIEQWQKMLDAPTLEALLTANNQPAPRSFRLNQLRPIPASLMELLAQEAVPSELLAGAYRFTGRPSLQWHDFAHQGLIYFQDEASQIVAALVDAQPGMTVLDVCAAPGSKTTALAAAMRNTGRLIAGDYHQSRVRTLIEQSQRLNVTNLLPMVYDASKALPFAPQTFARILVDAPCSGSGTLRHNPEIKWRLVPEKITTMAHLQRQILRQAAPLLQPGGQLVYATCSLEQAENEDLINDFLATQPQFQLAASNLTSLSSLITPLGYYRTWPSRDNTDGFFAAVLVRQS
jgi:16S rRNA (cytosine967-C5)-methyltransferase